METSDRPPEDSPKRVFKAPMIAPLAAIGALAVLAGYLFCFAPILETGVFSYVRENSFELFVVCQAVLVALAIYNKKQLDTFLNDFPSIDDSQALEELKPILRTNVYSALFSVLFLGVGIFAGIVTLMTQGLVKGGLVAVIYLTVMGLIQLLSRTEERAKQIECSAEDLEVELNSILKCWLEKPLPNF